MMYYIIVKIKKRYDMKKTVLLLLAAILALSLFACGKKSAGKNENEHPNIGEENKEPVSPEAPNEDFVLDLKESNTRKVWVMGSLTYVFIHDGDKITSTELYTDCNSPDTAKKTAESLKKSHADDKKIKSVEAVGKYVRSVYSEEYMPYKKISDVEKAVSIADGDAPEGTLPESEN